MHFLYLDDSGSVGNPSDKHVILAGLSVFERQPYWISRNLDNLANDLWPTAPTALEFHGTDMWGGKKRWRAIKRDDRIAAYKKALDLLSTGDNLRLFGAVIHKGAVSPDDPMELAFEQLCLRFDRMLVRLHRANDTQRGLIVLDKSSYETSLQRLAVEFRTGTHDRVQTRNIAEVPLLVDSKATRMIQYADLIAYSLRRYYEYGDALLFDRIKDKFDSAGGILHGLIHRIPNGDDCNCHCCRRKPRNATMFELP